jgi:hypothetical protein
MMRPAAALQHGKQFERDWATPGHTAIDLPEVDVNRVLAEHYDVDPELAFTRTTLWDMEVRKAYAPDRYIPSVVKPGSLLTWVDTPGETGENFIRVTQQRRWLDPARYGFVLERVHVDHERQIVFFIGSADLVGPDGLMLRAGTGQPLFHVEHSVTGTESQPINRWRIVHLTDSVHDEMRSYFEEMGKSVWLREFIEVYIREDLKSELTRRTREPA